MKENRKIVFYDGDCGFCNSTVQFILAKNKTAPLLYFSALQSDFCTDFFEAHKQKKPNLNTIVFYDNGHFFVKSTAAIKITAYLKHWRWFKVFFIVPKFLRDAIYTIVAKNRKKIKPNDVCVTPNESEKSRFLN